LSRLFVIRRTYCGVKPPQAKAATGRRTPKAWKLQLRFKSGSIRRLLLFLFSHRTLALIRWDLHFTCLRFTNLILLRKKALLKRIAQTERPLYLNLGSGPRGSASNHWINVDGYADTNVQYLMDFSRSWPFPDSSIDGIFCEHVFEHFDFAQGQALLRESMRVLQPGGCIRIIVPDGQKILETYVASPTELLAHRDHDTQYAMEVINSYFRQRYEHQFIYDWQLLKDQLAQAGFDRISEVSFGEGDASNQLLLDDERYAWESLYVEASKPAQM
jgi:predicted SAM-dependent methyltransferase